MAVTLALGAPKRVTLGSSNVQTQIILPVGSRRLFFKFESNVGSYETSGTDGGSRDATDYMTFPADSWVDIRPEGCGAGTPGAASSPVSVYLSSPTGSTVVQVYATTSES